MEERHTAANGADELTAATDAWGWHAQVMACVHDNASNIIAYRDLNIDQNNHDYVFLL